MALKSSFVFASRLRSSRNLIFLLGTFASAAEFKATNTSIEITAGSLGSFTLSYLEFEPAHKIIEVKAVAASAMLRYEGGAQSVVSAGKMRSGSSSKTYRQM